jgi:hypothetical protein
LPNAKGVSSVRKGRYGWAIAAAMVGVQTGAAIVASRAVVHELGPASLAFLRHPVDSPRAVARQDRLRCAGAPQRTNCMSLAE